MSVSVFRISQAVILIVASQAGFDAIFQLPHEANGFNHRP
jgi:hypothetical protein